MEMARAAWLARFWARSRSCSSKGGLSGTEARQGELADGLIVDAEGHDQQAVYSHPLNEVEVSWRGPRRAHVCRSQAGGEEWLAALQNPAGEGVGLDEERLLERVVHLAKRFGIRVEHRRRCQPPSVVGEKQHDAIVLDDLGNPPGDGIEKPLRIAGRLGERAHGFRQDAQAFLQTPAPLDGVVRRAHCHAPSTFRTHRARAESP